jgi:hypothetical protein
MIKTLAERLHDFVKREVEQGHYHHDPQKHVVSIAAERIAELEAKLDKARELLADAQQTPMAPNGVKHVWADDLQSALGDEE